MTQPYRVIVADPPWAFSDKLPGKSRGAAKNYACMSVADICSFPLPPIAADAWLFLWRVSSMPEEALRVVRAWGFVPKSEIVWLKMTKGWTPAFGLGRYVRAAHETCIVATRGRVKPACRSVRSVFGAQRQEHSRKPDVFLDIVEELTGADAVPRLEMFARRHRAGWTCMGNELPSAAE